MRADQEQRGVGTPLTLYRLTGATGVWTKGNTSESFTLAMSYDSIHNIVGKDQAHKRLISATDCHATPHESAAQLNLRQMAY